MSKFWKGFWAFLGIDLLTGFSMTDGTKGGIGCAWGWIFGLIFFPLWLIFKIISWPFRLIFRKK